MVLAQRHAQTDNWLVACAARFHEGRVQSPKTLPTYARVGGKKQLVISEDFLLPIDGTYNDMIERTE